MYDRSRSPSPDHADDPFAGSSAHGPVEIEFESAPLTLHPDGYEHQSKAWSASQTTLAYGGVPFEDGDEGEEAREGLLALPGERRRSGSAQSMRDWQDRAAPLQRGATRKVKLTKGHFVVVSVEEFGDEKGVK